MPEIRGDETREMMWLLRDRTAQDLEASGWASLLGGRENLKVEVVQGVDHFSIVEGPRGGPQQKNQEVGRHMARLGGFVAGWVTAGGDGVEVSKALMGKDSG